MNSHLRWSVSSAINPTLFAIASFSLLALSPGLTYAEGTEQTFTQKDYGVVHAKGYVQSRESFSFLLNSPHEAFTGTQAAVPAKYSIRGNAGPVEDQGQCGSCWDFSLTSVLRGTWIMSGQDPGRLSFNYLLNCATDAQGCNGGDFTSASYFVSPKGAPAYGSDGPYTAADGTCMAEPAVAQAVDYKMLGLAGVDPTFQDIAYVIGVLHKPVSIDVAVNNDWENYSSGVYNKCNDESPSGINHMVAIEGYDCESSVDSHGNCVFNSNGSLPPTVGTWLIRNSWGTSWGDSGYITTKATDKRGYRCNAVATTALYYDVSSAGN